MDGLRLNLPKWSAEQTEFYLDKRKQGFGCERARNAVLDAYPDAYAYSQAQLNKWDRQPEVAEVINEGRAELDEALQNLPFGRKGERVFALGQQAEILVQRFAKENKARSGTPANLVKLGAEFRATLKEIREEIGIDRGEKAPSWFAEIIEAAKAADLSPTDPAN